MPVKAKAGINDLATTHPELAKEWHPVKNKELKISDVTSGSGKRVWWKCKNGHEWEARINHRVNNIGCPYCCGRFPVSGETDLQTVNPKISDEWNYQLNKGLTDKYGRDISSPNKILPNSNQKVWWSCKQGHSWATSPNHRSRGNGCPVCVGQQVLKDENDLQKLRPDIAAQWDYEKNKRLKDKKGNDISTPDKVTAGSTHKVWWHCQICEYKWKVAVSHRTSGNGCPACAGKILKVGLNDLATTHPRLANEWSQIKNGSLTPQNVMAGSHKKIWWKCANGHEWQAAIYNRTADRGCPICKESHGEKNVRAVLINNNVLFEEQYKFNDRVCFSKKSPLKDDFAIFDNNGKVVATIEYHGKQHYEPVDFRGNGDKWAQKEFEKTQLRDKSKSDYLKTNNIPQLIIPYWEFDNIEQIVTNYIQNLSITHNVLKPTLSTKNTLIDKVNQKKNKIYKRIPVCLSQSEIIF